MTFDPRTGGQQPNAYGPPSFRDSFAPATPLSTSTKWLWLLLAGGMLMTLLCCGGGVGVMIFGFNIITVEIKDQVRDNPKFREHVGEVNEFEMDFAASFASQNSSEDTYRYKVRGSKGAGELTVKRHSDDDGKEVIDEASLRLEDGTMVQIIP